VLALVRAPLLAQDTTGSGGLRGTVRDGDGQLTPDVTICLIGTGRCTSSDAAGRFVITDVRAGSYDLAVTSPSSPALETRVDVRRGRETAVEITLPASQAVVESLTVSAPRFVPSEEIKASAFLASRSDIAQSAGALQDVSRYVQSLPGTTFGGDDFRNDLIVRGGSPLENLYIVDNVEIPNINAFGNLASAGGTVGILDAQLLQDVTFLTGGYPAAYGNRTSSVLQIALREGSRERAGGRATVGFAGAGVVAEAPLGSSRGSIIASARRSFLDLFTQDVGIGGVPVVYTGNVKATYDFSAHDRVWILNVTAVDRVRLGLTDDSDPTEELSNLDIRYRGGRSATGINWQRTFGTKGIGLLGVTMARAWVDATVRDILRAGLPAPELPVDDQLASAITVFEEDSAETETTVKYDLSVYGPRLGKLQVGLSARRTDVRYETASPFGTDSPYFRESDQNPIELNQRAASYLTSAYVQSSRLVGRRVNVTAGARVDRFGLLEETRVSPRGGVSVDVLPGLSVRGSAGVYYQQPLPLFVAAFEENRRLKPFRATHVVGGVVWSPDPITRGSAEVYFKGYEGYPVSTQVPSLSLANVGDTFAVRDVLFPMASVGSGDAVGLEMQIERRPTDSSRWYGLANLSVARARQAGSDDVRRPTSFDSPIVANVIVTGRLRRQWELSARVTYLAGRPYTPFDLGASQSARRAIYDVTAVNSLRVSDYFRADIRVDRAFTVNGRQARVFAGVQNLTNRRNVAGMSWNRRDNAPTVQEQLGLFPVLGLDWKF
jgi:hypothetical protein